MVSELTEFNIAMLKILKTSVLIKSKKKKIMSQDNFCRHVNSESKPIFQL